MIRLLNEDKMVKFGGELSPEYGWCLIMSGGAGSGKGFVQSHVMDFNAKVLDVDELKKMYTKALKRDDTNLGRNTSITKRDYDFKNPEDVTQLHFATKKYGQEQRKMAYSGVFTVDGRLTNITFDITGKNPKETIEICRNMKELGYKICYVWVLTNRQEAMIRNVSRERVVGDDIFHAIHNAVNEAVPEFLKSSAATIIDDAWLVFSSTGHAGATPQEMKLLTDKRAIELKKTSHGFIINNKLMHRIAATLGDQEVMDDDVVDKNNRRYMSQDDVIKSLKRQGIEPSEKGSYKAVRTYDDDFLNN